MSLSSLPQNETYGHLLILAAILDFPSSEMSRVILMYSIELLICENLYFVTNFIKLSDLEQKLCPFIGFVGHLGGHFGFNNFPQ